ncbi:MAG: branched-chain amino acid ABC transporter permease [Armatimonadota bacterium]
MAIWKRLLWGAIIIGALLAANWWATAMFQAVLTRPDLQKLWFYKQFAVYYPVVLEMGRWIILAVSLNLINGLAGQFSLGHAAFAAIGGYAAGAVTVYLGARVLGPAGTWFPGAAPLSWNLLFAASLVVAGLFAAAMGFVVGLPSLRLRGDYLAIVTLGFGEVVRVIIEHIQPLGGSLGFNGIPPITNFFWMYLMVFLTVLANRNIAASGFGRALLAIREDEIAAESMGVSLTRYKVAAFMIGAFFAGTAGALFAHTQGSIQPTAAGFLDSILIVVMVVLGGLGSISGCIIAAILLTILPEVLRTIAPMLGPLGGAVEQLRMVLYALMLIVLMLTRPQGLMGGREISVFGLFSRRRREIGTKDLQA